jgi:hypothetical protein
MKHSEQCDYILSIINLVKYEIGTNVIYLQYNRNSRLPFSYGKIEGYYFNNGNLFYYIKHGILTLGVSLNEIISVLDLEPNWNLNGG